MIPELLPVYLSDRDQTGFLFYNIRFAAMLDFVRLGPPKSDIFYPAHAY